MKLTVALIVLCVVATGSAQQPEAPFKHPKAVQAWNRYQFRENKAREAYDREVAAAKAEYLVGLREAASLAAKAGDAGDVKAISEAMGKERRCPVVSARYTDGTKTVDVTTRVSDAVLGGSAVHADGRFLGTGDIAPGVTKTLIVDLSDGTRLHLTDGSSVRLTMASGK